MGYTILYKAKQNHNSDAHDDDDAAAEHWKNTPVGQGTHRHTHTPITIGKEKEDEGVFFLFLIW